MSNTGLCRRPRTIHRSLAAALPRVPRLRIAGGILLAALAPALLLPSSGGAHDGGPAGERECPCCISPAEVSRLARARGASVRPTQTGVTRVGFLPLPGYNADVWGHAGYAYVGSENTGASAGVAVVDLRNPTRPALVGRVAGIPGTIQQDLAVARLRTPSFRGDLLVVGIQALSFRTAYPRGLDLWDVSNPRRPRRLAFWASDPAWSGVARGVHELFLFQRGQRAYVAAMVPDSEDLGGAGDFRLVDVTDPRRPFQVSAWGAVRDGGLPPGVPWGHSATVNARGTLAVLSLWDGGNVFLDLTDPARPLMRDRLALPASGNGKIHSVTLARNETLMLVSDELLAARPGPEPWGYLRLWDIRSLTSPRLVGRYRTPNAARVPARTDGLFTIHNSWVRGDRVFLSWYSDGVRVLNISNPAAPRPLAAFVPSGALIWGVYADGDLLLASDINAGLYVLRIR